MVSWALTGENFYQQRLKCCLNGVSESQEKKLPVSLAGENCPSSSINSNLAESSNWFLLYLNQGHYGHSSWQKGWEGEALRSPRAAWAGLGWEWVTAAEGTLRALLQRGHRGKGSSGQMELLNKEMRERWKAPNYQENSIFKIKQDFLFKWHKNN